MIKVGLDPSDKTKVDHYSMGMKQKLGLAQAAILSRHEIWKQSAYIVWWGGCGMMASGGRELR